MSKYQHNEENLLRFLKKKQPIIERALSQNEKNIYFDYSALKANEKYIFINNGSQLEIGKNIIDNLFYYTYLVCLILNKITILIF